MTLLQKLITAANAVKAGESLQDPAKWKNRSLLMVPFGIITSAIFNFTGIDVPQDALNAINFGLATLGSVLFTYFTAATTTKIGL